jgi:hypothetical protein
MTARSRRRHRDTWWSSLTGGTKAFISALVGGIVLTLATGPLGPILKDLGTAINPFEGSKNTPRVVVVAQSQDFTNGWIVPKPLERIGILPIFAGGSIDLKAWEKWELRENAVPADSMNLSVSLQGGSAKSVLITGLEIRIEHRRAPLSGTWVGELGGGAVYSRYFNVDLDHPSGAPEVKAYAPPPGRSNEIPGEVVDFPYFISESELEYLVLVIRTRECDCEWTGELHWIVDGRTGNTRVDNNGKPFRITASENATTRAIFRSADPQPRLVRE